MQKHILVTGANGFVGRNMVLGILQAGYKVTALSRNIEWLQKLDYEALLVNKWNGESSIPASIFQDVDIVCHLAAFIPADLNNIDYAVKCIETNAVIPYKVIADASKYGIQHFIYFSSGNIYLPQTTLAKETDQLYPVEHGTFYLMSKISGETYIQNYAQKHDIQTTILRLASVYGPYMHKRGVMYHFVRNALSHETLQVFNGGKHRTDFVFVQDIVSATVSVLKENITGVFNIGSGQSTTLKSLAYNVLEVLDLPFSLLDIHPPSSVAGGGFSALNISKARDLFGYKPTPLHAGLQIYIDWLRLQ